MNNDNLKLGLTALEHARDGGQANLSPEMARAVLERVASLDEILALAREHDVCVTCASMRNLLHLDQQRGGE